MSPEKSRTGPKSESKTAKLLELQHRLRESERRLNDAQRVAHVGYWERDFDAHRATLSEETCRILGWSPVERSLDLREGYERWLEVIHPEDRLKTKDAVHKALSGGPRYNIDYRVIRPDGAVRFVHSEAEVILDESGKPCRMFGIMQDITERWLAEQRLRASESRFRIFVDHATDAFLLFERGGKILDVNRHACECLGYTREELMGMTAFDVDPTVDDIEMADIDARLDTGETLMFEKLHRRKDGSVFPVEVRIRAFWEGGQRFTVALVRDITERNRTLERLRASEERFRELAENIQDVFWVPDPGKDKVLYVSPAYEKVWGRSCQDLQENPRLWLEAVHPEDRDRVWKTALTRQRDGSYDEVYRIIQPDRQERWVRDRAFPVRRPDGTVERIVGVARDITEQIQLEEQLRQSQKMEAIGQLAGGVAHDFNNILTVISGNAQLALMDSSTASDELRASINYIAAAAERGANLTKQLLLFGRKQVMQPHDLNLNEVVTNVARMLQRIIGEDVRLQLDLHPGSVTACADAGMLDQVLMNVAVNARDAMPDGGSLIIQTGEEVVEESEARFHPDAAPGRYARLSVRDTGNGMTPEILSRVFEPFFTTKEPGKGTGLGLATAFGIVKQHHGWISVSSEPGRGTEFQIFLPASDGFTVLPVSERELAAPHGSETVLLVEDDPPVRLLARTALERHGYSVLEAANGPDTLKLWDEHGGSVALLLTDLVMPGGMSGQQLARRLQRERKSLKVIFASGYSKEIAGGSLTLKPGEHFLQKPYLPDDLLETVRRCLDQS